MKEREIITNKTSKTKNSNTKENKD